MGTQEQKRTSSWRTRREAQLFADRTGRSSRRSRAEQLIKRNACCGSRSVQLLIVAVWKLLMPCPGAFDDRIERLKPWSPTKLVFDFFRRSNKSRRITRSAWLFNRVDLPAGDLTAGGDYLPYAGAASRAEIVESAGGCAKSQNMCLCEIDDMNVVANTCSVGRVVIRAVNFEIRSLAQRDLQHGGNQMCFGAMILAEVLCSTRGVEVAQSNKLQSMDLVVPTQNLLESEFRFSVRIDRTRGRSFVDRHALGRSKERASR